MTLRSRIFFSALAFRLVVGLPLAAATVSGRVELVDSRETSVRRDGDFQGVAVWLEPSAGEAQPRAAGTHTIRQKGKRFIPHVSVVQTGTVVDWPNLDPIFHNAFSNFAGQPFDTGLYPPGGTRKVRFTRAGVVRVFCNIHSTMSAVVVVVNTPWHAVTGRDGSFRIEGVPPGEYQLHVWHERAREEVLGELTRKVVVAANGLEMTPIRISESGHLELPHKNKYGREYPPEPAERSAYPGGKR
jgi:plastocyanin